MTTSRKKIKEFNLQLNEATDRNKDVHLICYVRFLDDVIVEGLVYSKSITVGSKAQDLIFRISGLIYE